MKFCFSCAVIAVSLFTVTACGTKAADPGTTTDTVASTDVSTQDSVDVTSVDTSKDAADQCCKDHGAECGIVTECSKNCGLCGAGKTCDSGTHKCKAVVTKTLGKFGEPCGPNKDCKRPASGAPNSELQAYFQCLNDECEDGECSGGICTKPCNIVTDDKNNSTGESGPDGIEDVGAVSDCGGAVDGPYGTKFACVQLLSPQNPNSAQYIFCTPESSYKPCKADSECDSGDTCQLQLIYGAYQQMCAPAAKTPVGTAPNFTYKAGQKLAQNCNDNPENGDIATCANNFCSTGGSCLGFCKTDADCATAVGACSGGKCADGKTCSNDGDCSAYQCKPNVAISSSPAFSASLCLPRDCTLDGDCGDGFYCRPYWNGVKNPAGEADPKDKTKLVYPAFQPGCQPIAPGAVKPGEQCDPYVNSTAATKKGKACQDPFACSDGHCGGLCKKDSDCAKDQLCGLQEIPLDVDNPKHDGMTDGIYDFELSLDICSYMPGAKGACASNKDCSGTSSYCKSFVHHLNLPKDATPVGKDTIGGMCVTPDSSAAKVSEVCGPAANDAFCQSGYCFNTQGQNGATQPGFCSDLCNSHNDCPATMTIGKTDYKTICRSLRLGFNGTLTDIRDDLWLPVCYPIDSANSLTDCSATKKCSGKEACLPFTIASGPELAAKVEFLCAMPGSATTPPTKAVGEACNPNPAATDPAECKDGLGCTADAGGKGYCTALCSKDADCGGNDGMICDLKNEWLPRTDVSKSAIVPICKKAKSCVPCGYDGDCAGNYACTNFSTTSVADGRCAPGCSTDADCTGKDGGSKCVAAIGMDGKTGAKKVCTPSKCQ